MKTVTQGSARAVRHLLRLVLAATLAILGMAALAVPAQAAAPPPGLSPVLERSPNDVTADELPTVQIDGVVWTEVVVGNTVFAGGSFANARPAGAAAGTQLTPRGNLLSFDITTGQLNTSFAPSLNGEVKTLAVSPDGKRLYVGGAFTTANGVNRYRIAAYNIATGQLDTTWAPALDAEVNSISVTNNAVYVGGNFSTANSVARAHLAAFDPVSGALLGWAPATDTPVQAVQVTPDHSLVIVGGNFQHINGGAAYGLGAVDANTGALVPWAGNQVVQDAGSDAAILNLTTDGTAIYSSAYVYGNSGNFEGVGSFDPDTGNINWLADCHGDTYGTYTANSTVYVVSHMHYCANIGGFPDTNPRTVWHRATAFTTQATGTVATNGEAGAGYGNFGGEPSPSLINWIPDLDAGTYTGQSQAAWSVTGNNQYVVLGGEFPKVNGVAQQGLVRFAVPSIAPNKEGPRVSAGDFIRNATPLSSTTARIDWQTNWDRDDENLTYQVKRNGVVVYTTTAVSQFWNRPMIGFIDTGLTPNTSYTYRVIALDPDGNSALANTITITTPASGSGTDPTAGPYPQDVLKAGASNYWRLDGLAGSASDFDLAGFNDLTVLGGTSLTSGAISGDSDQALSFNGSSSNGYAYSSGAAINGPNVFSIGAWFKTTSSNGGKIVGFGNAQTGNSSSYDRQIYMDNSGHIYFGVYNNNTYTINTSKTYRDGKWHQVVGTLSSSGMSLYVDGALVGTNSGTNVGQAYTGYWRIGGDNLSSWPGSHNSNYFNGSIDDVAIYPTALPTSEVQNQYLLGSGTSLPNAAFTANPNNLSVSFDASGSTDSSGTITSYAWDFGDGSTDTTSHATDTHTYAASGTYTVKLTVTDSNGGSNSTSQKVTVLGPNQLPNASFTDTVTGANVSFDASGSNDPDGNVVSYAWDFGDGKTDTTSNPTDTHSYTNSGTFHVTLTVTDNRGGTNSVTHDVMVATQPPQAAFSSSVNLMTATFDGSGSTSVGSTITSYDWDYGDGSSVDHGVTPAPHTYAKPGTYQVTLTVHDNTGQTSSVTHPVTVTNVIASDTFSRTVTNGWGTADVGGAWSRTGGASNFLVDGSRAQVTLASPGVSPNATLDSVSATDVNMVADINLNAVPTGDSVYAILVARHTSSGDVRFKVRIMPGGVVHLIWSTVSGKEVTGGEKAISGLTYNAGDTLRVHMHLVGSTITGSVWNPSTGNEPANPQVTGTLGANGTANITGAGSVGLYSGLGGSATNAPIALRYDNLSVTLG